MVYSELVERLYTTYTLFKNWFRQVHMEHSVKNGTSFQASK